MSTVGHSPPEVNDAQWEALQLVLPSPQWRPGGPGRKPMDLRRVINGIFYVNKTGCQWRREQGDAGGNFKTPVEWPGLFTCHSNPEKPPYARQTTTRHV